MSGYGVYITGGIWPTDSGARMHSFGLCNEFSKFLPLKIFAFLDGYVPDMGVFPFAERCQISFGNMPKRNLKFCAGIQIRAMLSTSAYLNNDWIMQIEKAVSEDACKLVFIDQISMYAYFRYFVKKYPKKKYIYISHNVEYINVFEKYFKKNDQVCITPGMDAIKKYVFYLGRKQAERDIVRNSDYVFSISPDDTTKLKEEFGGTAHYVFSKPLIQFEPLKSSGDMNSFQYRIVFAGSMSWYPNVEGILWFAKNVMPQLIDRNDSYKLFIVGRNPDESLLKLQQEDSRHYIVTGEVPSTREYYEMCDISVIPLFSGMGTKIKVLESVAYGIPTVCTHFSALSYGFTDEVLFADNADEFVSSIVKIEESANMRRYMHKKMNQYYKKYMCADTEIVEILENSKLK